MNEREIDRYSFFIPRLSRAHNRHYLALEDIGIGSAMTVQWNLFHRHYSLIAKPRSHTGLVAMPGTLPGTSVARLDLELPDEKACLDISGVGTV